MAGNTTQDETPADGSPSGTEVGAGPATPDWLPPWEIVALATGDLITLLLFAAVDRTRHHITSAG